MRILLIEDKERLSSVIKKGLKEDGFAVDVAFDGEEGQYLAESESYDLIILDIMLPNMVGVDILRHLKEEKPNLHSKVIITTNLEQSKENRAEVEKHADGYIIKAEVTPRQLVEFLNNIK